MPNLSLIQESITDIICDYLEVIIHEFFYYTHYYDPVLFERRTKYNVIVYMCRSPDVIIYVQNLVKSLRQWLSRDGLMDIHFQMVTIEGELIQSIAIKQVCDGLSRHEMIDYSKLEDSLHNSLLSFSSTPFITEMPNSIQFNVKIDICENSTAKSESGWNLSSSSADRQPLFPQSNNSSVSPLSTIYAGETNFQVFSCINRKCSCFL